MEIFRKLGSWLFLIGILVSVIVGLIVGANWYADENLYVAGLIAGLGFVVGVLSFFAIGNIAHDKVPTFLIAALILVGISAIGQNAATWTIGSWTGLAPYFTAITTYIAMFAAPAAGLLAIRAIWDAGKTEDIEKVIPKKIIDIPKKVMPK